MLHSPHDNWKSQRSVDTTSYGGNSSNSFVETNGHHPHLIYSNGGSYKNLFNNSGGGIVADSCLPTLAHHSSSATLTPLSLVTDVDHHTITTAAAVTTTTTTTNTNTMLTTATTSLSSNNIIIKSISQIGPNGHRAAENLIKTSDTSFDISSTTSSLPPKVITVTAAPAGNVISQHHHNPSSTIYSSPKPLFVKSVSQHMDKANNNSLSPATTTVSSVHQPQPVTTVTLIKSDSGHLLTNLLNQNNKNNTTDKSVVESSNNTNSSELMQYVTVRGSNQLQNNIYVSTSEFRVPVSSSKYLYYIYFFVFTYINRRI